MYVAAQNPSKPDTIRLLPNARIVFNSDTLRAGKTNLREFQQLFSINNDSLAKPERRVWDGTSVNISTGKTRGTGGIEHIQRVPYRDLQLVFKGPRFHPDSLVLESLTFAPQLPCDPTFVNSVLLFTTDNISSGKPHATLDRIFASADSQSTSRVFHRDNIYYTFDKEGYIIHLVKCGELYRLEQVIAQKQR